MKKPYAYKDVMLNNSTLVGRKARLSQQVKALRKELRMSQDEFAKLVQETAMPYGIMFGGKYGQVLVSEYERDVCCPKSETKWAICRAADIEMEMLTGYKQFKAANRYETITVPFRRRHPKEAQKVWEWAESKAA